MQHLQPNTLLQGGRYKIIDMLGQGGFGITYLAVQSGLERKVAVKEFFMKELCNRDESTSHVTLGTEGSRETVNRFREKFLKEARNIARLNHPNIVRIIDVFEENGTAYYVMEYAENGSLADKVKREGYLSEFVATRYIKQVAEALDYIHQRKMNHLDVKPANIMLNEKDDAVLIDFGLSKQYDATTGNQTSATPVGISEGYAPMEQYMQGGVGAFSPETDIYALGATLYKLLTGVTPPNASLINNEGVPMKELKAKGISENIISLIEKSMEGRKIDRIKSTNAFLTELKRGDCFVYSDSNIKEGSFEATIALDNNDNDENHLISSNDFTQRSQTSEKTESETNTTKIRFLDFFKDNHIVISLLWIANFFLRIYSIPMIPITDVIYNIEALLDIFWWTWFAYFVIGILGLFDITKLKKRGFVFSFIGCVLSDFPGVEGSYIGDGWMIFYSCVLSIVLMLLFFASMALKKNGMSYYSRLKYAKPTT